MTPFVSFL